MNFIKTIVLSTLLTMLFNTSGFAQSAQLSANKEAFTAANDPRVRIYMAPKKIFSTSDSNKQYVRNVENLLKVGNGQAELVNKDLTVLKSTKQHKPYIILDFGKEVHGGLQIVTGLMKSKKSLAVRVRFGESVSEAMSEIDTLNGATNDHAMRDFVVNLPWLGGLEVGNTGFRFVRIDLLDSDVELLLKEVRAVCVYRDIPYLGSFKCDDDRLNKIWETGAYTVHLNMQQYLWDGVKRDRLVWVGDMHPEVMTINSVFGYNDVVPKSLDLIRDVTPLPAWMNGISSYSMWWIIIQKDWYLYQGDLAYLKKQRVYLVNLLNHLMGKVKDNREELDGNRFLDWPSSENAPAIHAGLQAMMILSLDAGAELCNTLGEKLTAQKCKEVIKVLKSHTPSIANSKQAAALMTLSQLIQPQVGDAFISKGGVNDFSTFYGYYMLQAKAKAGNYIEAIDNIKQYWGAMLDLGATTFWEDFNIKWTKDAARIDELPEKGQVDVHSSYGDYCYKSFRHSLAHGWASGPTAWLTEHVLGVKVLAPGCRVISVKPNLGNLKYVEGNFPTPLGIVRIKHQRLPNGTLSSRITAPAGIKVVKN